MSELIKFDDSMSQKDKVIQLHEGTKKFRTFKDSEWERIGMEISGLAVLLGVKQITDGEVKYVVDFLKAEAKDFSYSEFKHALHLNTAGRFGEIIKPFGSILNYVGSIISEYRKYRAKYLAKKTPEKVELTEEQKKQAEVDINEEVFKELCDRFRANKINFTYIDSIKYFNCLKWLNIMPDYKDKNLWELAKEKLKENYRGSLDKESRLTLSYLEGKEPSLSKELEGRLNKNQINIYKGLLLDRY